MQKPPRRRSPIGTFSSLDSFFLLWELGMMLSYDNYLSRDGLMPVAPAWETRQLLRRQTLTTQVIDHALGLIRSGRVKPGEKLPTEQQLTEKLGVSRTCVREAMKSLE